MGLSEYLSRVCVPVSEKRTSFHKLKSITTFEVHIKCNFGCFLFEIFLFMTELQKNILCSIGKGGIGKSTAMKHLAISWADGSDEELRTFNFVFHIALKLVRDNSPLENIIIKQHGAPKAEVRQDEIRSILKERTGGKVLLLIDGYDEYKAGRNTDIDEAIMKRSLWNCWLILTSRETEQTYELQEYMDAEAEILGFDKKNIETYISKVVPDSQTKNLLEQAISVGLCHKVMGQFVYKNDSILTVPMLLHMICILSLSKQILPNSVVGIIQAVVDRCMDREAIRAKGRKAEQRADQALVRLGLLQFPG